MPSFEHEAYLELLRGRPALALELLQLLGAEVPSFRSARLVSEALTTVQPVSPGSETAVPYLNWRFSLP